MRKPTTPRATPLRKQSYRGRALLATVLFTFLVLSVTAVPSALALSPERHYEMVSPLYKGGFGATHIEAVSPDGNAVAYFSPGQFNGSTTGLSNNVDSLTYLARRSSSGWNTVPIAPPDELAPYVNIHDISRDLSHVLDLSKPGATVEQAALEGAQTESLLHDTNIPNTVSGWEVAGPLVEAVHKEPVSLESRGTSANFCNETLEVGGVDSPALLKSAEGAVKPLYELDSGCNGKTPELRLASVDSKGKPISPTCVAEVGIFTYHSDASDWFGAVSADGGTVFLTTCVQDEVTDYQLFARLGGAKTIEVSRPIDKSLETCGESQIPCPKAIERASAQFAGASEDGSKVFFTTTAPLVAQDKDGGSDLYMAQLGCPSGEGCPIAQRRVTRLVQVSRVTGGEEGGLQGVVRAALDGARVYFVATADLLEGAERLRLEREGHSLPRQGADNLYVYDTASEKMGFVADLCSGYEASGAVEDSRCASKGAREVDKTLWTELAEHHVQAADAQGRLLIFSSFGRLTPDDSDASKDVYRYDAETGSLERVSIGEAGYDSNGNGAIDANISESLLGGSVQHHYELDRRSVSEDGSRIIFQTSEPLSPIASNGLVNVYEWHATGSGGGQVSLISGPNSEASVTDAVISPQGNDVFFSTSQELVPQDSDVLPDVYDARVGEGFPAPPALREPCSSDACQGPLTNPAPLLVPGSMEQAPGENLGSLPGQKTVKRIHKKPKRSKRARRRHGKWTMRGHKRQARKGGGRS
jgi:hypothetical protein